MDFAGQTDGVYSLVYRHHFQSLALLFCQRLEGIIDFFSPLSETFIHTAQNSFLHRDTYGIPRQLTAFLAGWALCSVGGRASICDEVFEAYQDSGKSKPSRDIPSIFHRLNRVIHVTFVSNITLGCIYKANSCVTLDAFEKRFIHQVTRGA